MKKYKERQYEKVVELMENTDVFYRDKGHGRFKGKEYPFVLKNEHNNLFKPFADEIEKYMNHYQAFWNGSLTSHTLSSQVACLNHLFPLRYDEQAVLAVAQAIDSSIVGVIMLNNEDFMPAYIQFEAVSNQDYLNEGRPNRGANCTSVDALICGERMNGDKVILPIEWKYVECYDNKRVYDEIVFKNGIKKVNRKGLTAGEERQRRYFDLIDKSKQLKPITKQISNFEPFYQLMRQTLWAEQMLLNFKTEAIRAADFIHVHIIPKKNNELLNKKYIVSNKDMEGTWRECLVDQSKYKIIEPIDLLTKIDKTKYCDLVNYLTIRYW